MGWVMGFEPTNTGTTIRCLRPLGDTHHIQFAEKVARQKGLAQSRSGSVKPSPATLIRVAFDCSSPVSYTKKEAVRKDDLFFGAADGTRTRTVSLPGDFKSPVSTDSTTAAYGYNLSPAGKIVNSGTFFQWTSSDTYPQKREGL